MYSTACKPLGPDVFGKGGRILRLRKLRSSRPSPVARRSVFWCALDGPLEPAPRKHKPREVPPPATRAVDPAPELARASEMMPVPRPHSPASLRTHESSSFTCAPCPAAAPQLVAHAHPLRYMP